MKRKVHGGCQVNGPKVAKFLSCYLSYSSAHPMSCLAVATNREARTGGTEDECNRQAQETKSTIDRVLAKQWFILQA